MEEYSGTLMSWGILGLLVAGGCYYYIPRSQRRPDRNRENNQQTAAAPRRRNEQGGRADGNRPNETTRKRKLQEKQPAQPEVPSVAVQADEPDEIDMSTKQWAQQMMKARKGHDLSSAKNHEQRVKTVKQSSALNTPVLSSSSPQAEAEADDDLSPAVSPLVNAGDISDMLEPTAPGPTTLRMTAPSKPQRERVVRQPKEDDVETKKQRQNRKKVEERKFQREVEEQERKALEEKQRRTARESRGEPAKNGIPAKAPTSNAWPRQASASATGTMPAPTVNGNHSAPLLDTFDAESTSSSNGVEASTGPTSTTSGGAAQWDQEMQSEEEQMAQAMKQSEDESGWTTVAQPKKQKKKPTEPVQAEPVLTNKTNIQSTKPAANGKPKGFQALDVQYEQRTDADPSDASNWDA